MIRSSCLFNTDYTQQSEKVPPDSRQRADEILNEVKYTIDFYYT